MKISKRFARWGGVLLGGWLGLTAGLIQTGLAEPIAQLEPSSTRGMCRSHLENQIQAIANRPEYRRYRWGIVVWGLDTGEVLYEQDADRYFLPASTVKLFTTAAVLHRLGPQFRIRTSVYQGITPNGETVLRLVGRGDPSLTDADLRDLARQVRDRGIAHVETLIVDNQFFQGDPLHPTWEWEDIQYDYGSGVNSLIVNQNAITLRFEPQQVGQPLRVTWSDPAEATNWQIENSSTTVELSDSLAGSTGVWLERELSSPVLRIRGQLPVGADPVTEAIAIPDLDRYTLQQVQQAFRAEQIAVGRVTLASTVRDASEVEVAAVESAPLSELLVETNQNSNNLYAEALLRQLGSVQLPELAAISSLDAGIRSVEQTLLGFNIDPDGYDLADGSGLSRHSLVSPEALVQVLWAMAQMPEAQAYRDSLAIAGLSGTLRNRFRDTPVEGRLWGKTGTVSGAVSLAGYLNPLRDQRLVFSIVVNQYDLPARAIRPAVDEIVQLLVQLQPC